MEKSTYKIVSIALFDLFIYSKFFIFYFAKQQVVHLIYLVVLVISNKNSSAIHEENCIYIIF